MINCGDPSFWVPCMAVRIVESVHLHNFYAILILKEITYNENKHQGIAQKIY